MITTRTKTILLATLSSLALAGAASAADLAPVYKAPPMAVASWTGFYIGANVGAVRHDFSFTDNDDWDFGSTFWTHSKTGVIGGGQIGYNWQSGSYVWGLEGDFDGMGLKQSTTLAGGSVGASTSIDWLSTVRVRSGLAIDRTLLYATGGLAIAQVKDAWGDGFLGTFGEDFHKSQTQLGWTVGGGVEHKFTPNWSLKGEVLYADLGTTSASANDGVATFTSTFTHTLVTGRVGLNYEW